MELNRFRKYINNFTNSELEAGKEEIQSEEILVLIMNKFTTLSAKDKLSFMLGNIVCPVANKETSDTDTDKVCGIKEEPSLELDDIEKENKVAMIKLRVWIIKTVVLTVVFSILVSLLVSLLNTNGAGTGVLGNTIDSGVRILKLLF